MSISYEVFVSGTTIAVGSFTAVLMAKFHAKEKEKQKKQAEEFTTTLLLALKNETVREMEDVTGLYRAIKKTNLSSAMSKGYIIPWLEKSVLQLHKIKSEDGYRKEEILEHLQFLKSCIKELADQEPFSDLPETERNLMTDVLIFGKDNNAKLFVSKLHDLGHVIKTRYEENSKLRDTTKWSVPISIIGVIVSVGFGLYTIFGK